MAKGEKTGGRKKGTPNKRSFDAIELAQEYDCDPLEFLLKVMTNDWKGLGFKSEFKPKSKYLKELKPNITFDQRIRAAEEALQYLYPKRKPVDKNGDDQDPLSKLLELVDGSKNS